MRVSAALAVAVLLPAAAAAETTVSHGLSLFDSLKYPPDFAHFDYVNPDAPKGGEIRLSATGTFDTLNPFIIKGNPAAGVTLIYDTLMVSAQDEPSTEYGLLAESVETPEDLSWVAFKLREGARWHDGRPVTPEDVIFTFQMLKEHGAPFYRHYYANVEKAEKVAERTVRFSFSGRRNRELPQIVGQLPVLPKHYWEGRDFNATTLEPPLGSGPYKVAEFDAGRSIAFQRVPDYWGADVPANVGRHNYGRIRFEYYRDSTVALEAFKAHEFDFRLESTAKVWATAYDFPAVARGQVVVEMLPDENPAGMQAFVMNLRRPQFQDRRTRQALIHTFDFEWSNRNLFYGQYTRTDSYFENSELAAVGLPGEAELKYLEPLRGQIPEEVFTTAYDLPKTDGSGRNRAQLREARVLLQEAGWRVEGGRLVDAQGRPLAIEILLVQPDFERVVAPMVRNMEVLGIQARIRTVDTSQYRNRIDGFDFDMTVGSFPQSLSPGNEQRDFWGSEAADRPGSRNLIGIKDPAIDKLIDAIIFAPDRDELVAACRALDRVLLWHHFVIPNWHLASFRVAWWNKFQRPEIKPKYGIGVLDTWWVDPEKARTLPKSAGGSRQ